MGTWGSGLYDNDQALDQLGRWVDAIDLNASDAEQRVGLGLRFWMQPSALGSEAEVVRPVLETNRAWEHDDAIAAIVRAYLDDPEAATSTPPSRTDETTSVLGTYCAGTFHAPFFSDASAREVLRSAFVDPCVGRLDAMLTWSRNDLTEGVSVLVSAGPLLELLDVGLVGADAIPNAEGWLSAFDAMLTRTKTERAFWRGYARSVRPGLARLARHFALDPDVAARRYGPRERFEVGERVDHPKFGRGMVRATEPTSVDIEFAEGLKKLVHGR